MRLAPNLGDRPILRFTACLAASRWARQALSAASISVAAAARACTTGAVSLSDVAIAVAPSNNTASCWPSRCGSAAPASRATATSPRGDSCLWARTIWSALGGGQVGAIQALLVRGPAAGVHPAQVVVDEGVLAGEVLVERALGHVGL